MLPSNIDLTENRDFNHPSSITEIFRDEVDYPTTMSSEDYERLMLRERFFGRKDHPNRTRIILGIQFKIPVGVFPWSCPKLINNLQRYPWIESTNSETNLVYNLFNSR